MTGDEIHMWRRQRKISQIDLAVRLGVTRQTISNWEGNKHRPPVDIICRLRSFDCIDAGLIATGENGETIYGPFETPKGLTYYKRYRELAWEGI